jgi:hydrogenase small subunit
LADLKTNPPTSYPRIVEEKGEGASLGAAALVAGVAGLAVGAGMKLAGNLGKSDAKDQGPNSTDAE